MSFEEDWQSVLAELGALPDEATFITPRTAKRFHIVDVRGPHIIIQIDDEADTRPLQRTQFETIYERVIDRPDGFELDGLPPDADPYPAVLSPPELRDRRSGNQTRRT